MNLKKRVRYSYLVTFETSKRKVVVFKGLSKNINKKFNKLATDNQQSDHDFKAIKKTQKKKIKEILAITIGV